MYVLPNWLSSFYSNAILTIFKCSYLRLQVKFVSVRAFFNRVNMDVMYTHQHCAHIMHFVVLRVNIALFNLIRIQCFQNVLASYEHTYVFMKRIGAIPEIPLSQSCQLCQLGQLGQHWWNATSDLSFYELTILSTLSTRSTGSTLIRDELTFVISLGWHW